MDVLEFAGGEKGFGSEGVEDQNVDAEDMKQPPSDQLDEVVLCYSSCREGREGGRRGVFIECEKKDQVFSISARELGGHWICREQWNILTYPRTHSKGLVTCSSRTGF